MEYANILKTIDKQDYIKQLKKIWKLSNGHVSLNFKPNKLLKTGDIVPSDSSIRFGGILSVPLDSLKKI